MSSKKRLKLMGNGGNNASPVVVNNPTKLSKQALLAMWGNFYPKDTKFRTEYSQTTNPKGEAVHNYSLFPIVPTESIPTPVLSTPQIQVKSQLDPMKQVGFNGMLQPMVQQFEVGGESTNPWNFVGNQMNGTPNGMAPQTYVGDIKGGVAPQGISTDELLKDKQQTFLMYLANKVETVNKGKSKLKRADTGTEVNKTLSPYRTTGLPVVNTGFSANQLTPFGLWNSTPATFQGQDNKVYVGTPDYVQKVQEANNSFQQKTDFVGAPQVDQAQRTYHNDIIPYIGEGVIAGEHFINSIFNSYNTNQNKIQLRKKSDIENNMPITYGNKGDYDTNSGRFRPNTMGMGKYELGGSYRISKRELERLKKQGYDIEIVD